MCVHVRRALGAILIFARLTKPVSKLEWLLRPCFWSDFFVKCWRNEVVPGLGENLSFLWRYKTGSDIAATSHYQQWQEAAESEWMFLWTYSSCKFTVDNSLYRRSPRSYLTWKQEVLGVIFLTIVFILSSPMWEKIRGPISLLRSASNGKLGTRLASVQIM